MEDWGENANAPKFSLFGVKSTPQEQAELDTFVNPTVYARWSKAERRLYQRLKTASIAKKIEEKRIDTFDELAKTLSGLAILRDDPDADPMIDDLIGKVQKLKVDKEDQH